MKEVSHTIWTAYVAVQYEGEKDRDFFTDKSGAKAHLRDVMGDDIEFRENRYNDNVLNVHDSNETGVVKEVEVKERSDS